MNHIFVHRSHLLILCKYVQRKKLQKARGMVLHSDGIRIKRTINCSEGQVWDRISYTITSVQSQQDQSLYGCCKQAPYNHFGDFSWLLSMLCIQFYVYTYLKMCRITRNIYISPLQLIFTFLLEIHHITLIFDINQLQVSLLSGLCLLLALRISKLIVSLLNLYLEGWEKLIKTQVSIPV